jgi:hypothetical protein
MFEQIAHPQKRAFLAAFAECGRVKQAAKAANISREAHYDWKAQDSDYATAFSVAQKLAGDSLEDEAVRRAKLGVIEPVLYRGSVVQVKTGKVDAEGKPIYRPLFKRKYSDRLLTMLLQGAKPEKYNTKTVEHKGEVRHQHQIDLSVYSDEELKLLHELANKARLAESRSDNAGAGAVEGSDHDPRSGSDSSGDRATEGPEDRPDVPGDGTAET